MKKTKNNSSVFSPYLGNLDTPIEQQLGSDVVLVLVDIVEQAPMRHQLCDQLDGGTQADAQQASQVGVLHASHDQGLLNETDTHSGTWQKRAVELDICSNMFSLNVLVNSATFML